MSLIHWIIQV